MAANENNKRLMPNRVVKRTELFRSRSKFKYSVSYLILKVSFFS